MNLSLLEYTTLIFIGIFLSAGIALSARITFTNIPWLKLLFRLCYLKELKQTTSYFFYLSLWIVVSVVFILFIADVIRKIDPAVHWFYEIIKYDDSDGKAGLLLLAFCSIGTYWYLTFQALKFNKNQGYNFLTFSSTKGIGKKALVFFLSPIKLIHYHIPRIISKYLLTWFYNNGKTPIYLCTKDILDRFNEETCLAFIESHIRMNKKSKNIPKLKEIFEEREGRFSNREKAHTLIEAKIALVGYSATERHICNFIRDNSNKEIKSDMDNRKKIRRIYPEYKNNIYLVKKQGATEFGSIVEYSEDGSGGFFRTKSSSFVKGEEITITNKKLEVNGIVQHGNARLEGDEIISGIGVQIKDDNSSLFLETIKLY